MSPYVICTPSRINVSISWSRAGAGGPSTMPNWLFRQSTQRKTTNPFNIRQIESRITLESCIYANPFAHQSSSCIYQHTNRPKQQHTENMDLLLLLMVSPSAFWHVTEQTNAPTKHTNSDPSLRTNRKCRKSSSHKYSLCSLHLYIGRRALVMRVHPFVCEYFWSWYIRLTDSLSWCVSLPRALSRKACSHVSESISIWWFNVVLMTRFSERRNVWLLCTCSSRAKTRFGVTFLGFTGVHFVEGVESSVCTDDWLGKQTNQKGGVRVYTLGVVMVSDRYVNICAGSVCGKLGLRAFFLKKKTP